MGTYLHPIIEDADKNRVSEQLAGVPQGTAARLQDISPEQRYEVIMDDFNLYTLDSFLSEGWGRVSSKFRDAVKALGQAEGWGDVTDPTIVRQLLLAQGLDADAIQPLISGLSWY